MLREAHTRHSMLCKLGSTACILYCRAAHLHVLPKLDLRARLLPPTP